MHCGKFQDALEPLLSWLRDTEELVANQKPPSAEYRVVKAQIQEQKVQGRGSFTHKEETLSPSAETHLLSGFQIPLLRWPPPHPTPTPNIHITLRTHTLSAVNFPGSQPSQLMLCQSKHTSAQTWFVCIVFKDTLAVAHLSAHSSCVCADKGGAASVIDHLQVFVRVVSV